MSTGKSTVKATDLYTRSSKRPRVRSCKDCGDPNPPLRTHTDPDYCRACVSAHATRCTTCTTLFTRDGVNDECRSCRDQFALFGASS